MARKRSAGEVEKEGILADRAVFKSRQQVASPAREWEFTVQFESGKSTTRPRPVDVYLGFEIVQEAEDRFHAIPQGWAGAQAPELQAPDLPTLRKLIWDWWFNLPS